MTDDTRYVAVMVVDDDTEAFKQSLVDVAERHEVSDWSIDNAQYVKADALRELIEEWRNRTDYGSDPTERSTDTMRTYDKCADELEALLDDE